MRKSKLDAPHIKRKVVKELATGKSQSKIAREIGLHPSQVSRFASKEEVKRLIEGESYRLLEAVPDAVQNIIDLVSEMRNIPKEDTSKLDLAYKASNEVLKAAGILPASAQSRMIVNIFKQANTTFLDPVIRKLIEQRQKDMELSPEDLAMLGWHGGEKESF